MSTILDAATFPLWGSRLIEASAGTGKTWTIAALYLRLVLGHGTGSDPEADVQPVRALRPAEILVMTFTRAATRELSDRIRRRLLQAAGCFRGEIEPEAQDDLLHALLASYPEGQARDGAAWRLATAAESMDEAAVLTIDAWCQRMLREHAFDSGCLFDEELVADEQTLVREAVQDYWRQQCYPLAGDELERVLALWGSVDALFADMRALINQSIPAQAGAGTLAQCMQVQLQQQQAALQSLSAGWVERAQDMQDWLDAQIAPKVCDWDRRKLAPGNYHKWLGSLRQWAAAPQAGPLELTDAACWRLCPQGILEARKPAAAAIVLPDYFQQFADLLAGYAALPDHTVAMRWHAAAHIAARMDRRKRQIGSFGFADMLRRLDLALAGANGAQLRSRILTRYPVAMIDEFQDTSPLQYNIFDQIYRTQDNDPATALLLIGDPKQSIYGFRGADIYSYLQARQATQGRHYVLGTNHRSTHALVDAVNQCFGRGEERLAQGAFLFKQGANNALPFVAVQARGRAEQFQTQAGAVPAITITHDLELHSKEDSVTRFAARCAEQIVTWLNDPQAGFSRQDASSASFMRLQPADMAVLVRTGKEALAVQRELRLRGVASVYLSDQDSVFNSDEARDLVHWLRAVASPLDVRLVRAGLATRTLGLSLDELAWLAASDEALDARSEQLRDLCAIWQSQGVLTMLRQTLHQLNLSARWLAEPGGERRMTNFLHLCELLQVASAQLDGEQAMIRWLELQIQQAQQGSASSEEQIVRLESDADLVKVVTVHKSKGLEYPIVLLPFACSFRAVERKYTRFVNLADEEGKRAIHLQFNDEQLTRADQERLREDLRLLYVALTRARHAVWMGFSALKVGKSASCQTHRSASGYLLGGPDPLEPEHYLDQLQELAATQTPIHIQLHAAAPTSPRTALLARAAPCALREPVHYSGRFERNWSIGSFSALVRALAAPVPMLQTTASSNRIDEDEPLVTIPVPPPAIEVAAWHRFMRGALAGNFLHDQLEWLASENFALEGNTALTERLRRRCASSGYAEGDEQIDAVVHWLTEIVRTPLPGVGVALRELQCSLPEMEFWLPAERMKAVAVDALCQRHLLSGRTRPTLPARELHGMLMGFADLVFEHAGRYWVLDYKSNFLGDGASAYHQDALEAAMAEHRYDVQAALYMLALHRLLRSRLGSDYLPQEHLGGAVYLFLRGIDGPQKGGYFMAPSVELLEALDTLLGAEEANV